MNTDEIDLLDKNCCACHCEERSLR